MITGAQMRAARALIRWSADDLAKATKLGVATIRRAEAEDGAPPITEANGAAIESALGARGIGFGNGGAFFRGLRVGDRVKYSPRSDTAHPIEVEANATGIVVEKDPQPPKRPPMVRVRFGDFETPWTGEWCFVFDRSPLPAE
jgi:hypothetical protein